MLIGGDNRVYRLSPGPHLGGALADQLAALAAARLRAGRDVPSRRTGEATAARAARACSRACRPRIWDSSGENPYFGMLALADAIVVTADPVSMVSEAAATGKPVHVVALDGGSEKFAHFHRAMTEAGITRPFRGDDRALARRPPTTTPAPGRRSARSSPAGSTEVARRWRCAPRWFVGGLSLVAVRRAGRAAAIDLGGVARRSYGASGRVFVYRRLRRSALLR